MIMQEDIVTDIIRVVCSRAVLKLLVSEEPSYTQNLRIPKSVCVCGLYLSVFTVLGFKTI